MTSKVLAELTRLMTYNPETGLFTRTITSSSRARAGQVAGYTQPDGYVTICVLATRYYAHRLAWLYTHHYFPAQSVDHIDRVKSNNRIANLRLASKKQNSENMAMRADNTSGVKGVSWRNDLGKWSAKIQHNKKTIHLGNYYSIREASAAYVEAANNLFTHTP